MKMIKLYYSKDNKYIIAELYNKYNKITVEYAENIAILKQKILYKLVNPKPNNNVYKYYWKQFYDKIKIPTLICGVYSKKDISPSKSENIKKKNVSSLLYT